MKSKIIITLLLLWAATLSIADVWGQNPKNYYVEEERTFKGGLKAGVNLSQVDGDSYKGYHKMGLSAGVAAYVKFRPQLFGSIEILFSQKGARSNGAQASNSGQYAISSQTIHLNYAEIPVMLNFFDKRMHHVGVGFSYSRLINSKEEIKLNNTAFVYDPNLYPFKKSDINFILSGNVHIVKGLYAGLRFQYSLITIRNKVDPEFGRPEQFSNIFGLSAMYLF